MTTWNPSDITTGMSLSGGNLTATSTVASGDQQVRSTTSKSSGKTYFEFTFTQVSGLGTTGIGFASGDANHTFNGLATGPYIGFDTASVGWWSDGKTYFNNVGTAVGNSPVTGDVVAVAIDFGAQLYWVNNITKSSGWLGGVSPNPVTGSGGVSIASLTGSPWFICYDTERTDFGTLNVGGSAFSLGPPSGFSAWDSQAAPVSGGGPSRNIMIIRNRTRY